MNPPMNGRWGCIGDILDLWTHWCFGASDILTTFKVLKQPVVWVGGWVHIIGGMLVAEPTPEIHYSQLYRLT